MGVADPQAARKERVAGVKRGGIPLLLLELLSAAIVVATPGDWPRAGAMLLVLSRWAVFFVARAAGRDLLSAIFQAVVPVFGALWLALGGRADEADEAGEDPAANGPQEEPEGEPSRDELLQLNVQLMSRSLSAELADASRRARSASPLVDVASGADYRTKQAVVIRLRELRSLKGIEALKNLRGQSDPDLQYLAATALASLEQSENAAILAGEERVLQMPRHVGERLALARSRIFLCQAGLLGGSMVQANLARAIEHLGEARGLARTGAERREAIEALSEAYVLLGRMAEAESILAGEPELSAAALERLAGLQLAAGKTKDLHGTCRRIMDHVHASEPLHEAAAARLAGGAP